MPTCIQGELFETAGATAAPAGPRHGNALSREAYSTDLSKLSARAVEILRWFRAHVIPCTDRDCKDALFGATADMNMVRPRVNDLIAWGQLRVAGKVRDHATGKRVRAVVAI